MSRAIHWNVVHDLVSGLLASFAEHEPHVYDNIIEIEEDEQPSMSNLSKFVELIAGFHIGSFDLKGRHKPRYALALLAWKAFFRPKDAPRPAWSFYGTLSHSWEGAETNYQFFPVDSLSEAKLADIISRHRTPVFQKLCLVDLPPELIHAITDYLTTTDARQFGSTCHIFRNISLQYIHKEQWLILDPRFAQEGLINYANELDSPPEIITELTLEARIRFTKRAGLICDNPDILKQLTTLHISGCWRIPLLDIDLVKDDSRCDEYYQPVFESIIAVLSRATGLRTLTLTNFKIPLVVAEAVTSLPSLRTLEFSGCQPTFDSISARSTSVKNVIMDVDETLKIWAVLSAMPNLRVLHVHGTMKARSTIPPISPNAINPFNTIERFVISELYYEDLLKLNDWIQEANGGQLSRLTHVKLRAEDVAGFEPIELGILIESLRGPYLEVLVLDGIDFGEVILLEWLAKAFPSLRSLTIFYLRDLNWPTLSCNYAKVLSGLSKLEYFRWNQSPECHDYTATISSLFEEEPDNSSPPFSHDDSDDLHGYARSTVKLFAAYCQNLTCFSFEDGAYDYLIERNAAGIVTLTEVDLRQRSRSHRATYHSPSYGDDVWNS